MYTDVGHKCDRCNLPLRVGQIVVLKYQGPVITVNDTELCISDDTSTITVKHLDCKG